MTRAATAPAGWQVVRLGDFVTYVKTVSLSRAQLDEGSPVRYLHYGDIHTRDSVRLPAGEELMPRAPGELIGSAGRLDVGDLVFADASEDPDGVGKSVEITSVPPEGVIAGSHTIAARFDKGVLADGFKGYLQFIPAFREALLRLAAGTKVLATTRSYISSVELALPSVDEQRAIAAVLSDADAEIDALEWAIRKKQNVRSGIVQQLLTGRSRLKGFDDVWTCAKLGTLGAFLKGKGINRSDAQDSGIPCIRYGEIYTTFGDYTNDTVSFVSPDVATFALSLETGDLLFAGSGETRDEIGMCVAYIGLGSAVAGGDIVVLRGHGTNPVFLAALMNSTAVVKQKARAGQGDAVVHIYARALAEIEVDLPSRAEQDAIAEIVTSADTEIRALKRRLEKALQIREGMMQELLTGRTRLPIAEVAA